VHERKKEKDKEKRLRFKVKNTMANVEIFRDECWWSCETASRDREH